MIILLSSNFDLQSNCRSCRLVLSWCLCVVCSCNKWCSVWCGFDAWLYYLTKLLIYKNINYWLSKAECKITAWVRQHNTRQRCSVGSQQNGETVDDQLTCTNTTKIVVGFTTVRDRITVMLGDYRTSNANHIPILHAPQLLWCLCWKKTALPEYSANDIDLFWQVLHSLYMHSFLFVSQVSCGKSFSAY